jgi:hypothetical protein
MPPAKIAIDVDEAGGDGLDELDAAEEAEVAAATVAPSLVAEEAAPALPRRKPRVNADEGDAPGK